MSSSPSWTALHVDYEGPLLVVTIDHPASELNAVDELLHRELAELAAWLKTVDDARAVVLTGRGAAFSAGGDMTWFPTLRAPDRLHALRREAKQIVWDLLDVELPVVVGLNGPAVGLGASVALLGDVIVMADDATIIDPHVLVGLVAGDGGAAVWPLLVGPLVAKRHLMLGDPLTAVAAERYGIAAEVCGRADVAERTRAWAMRFAEGAPLAVQGTKLAVNAQLKQALLTSFDVSTALEMPCFNSADHDEGVRAFVERRRPRFEGR